jgi:hypothetical protein
MLLRGVYPRVGHLKGGSLEWALKKHARDELSIQGFCENRQNQYCEGLKKHLDDPVPNSDFPVLHCLGIGSSVLDITLYCIIKCMSKL